jgi:hypothetical protein
MDKLLPYYEQELSKLRHASQVFAESHPQLASRLQLSGEASTDSEVERLLQSVALLKPRKPHWVCAPGPLPAQVVATRTQAESESVSEAPAPCACS